jgi:hypothetical protein
MLLDGSALEEECHSEKGTSQNFQEARNEKNRSLFMNVWEKDPLCILHSTLSPPRKDRNSVAYPRLPPWRLYPPLRLHDKMYVLALKNGSLSRKW